MIFCCWGLRILVGFWFLICCWSCWSCRRSCGIFRCGRRRSSVMCYCRIFVTFFLIRIILVFLIVALIVFYSIFRIIGRVCCLRLIRCWSGRFFWWIGGIIFFIVLSEFLMVVLGGGVIWVFRNLG